MSASSANGFTKTNGESESATDGNVSSSSRKRGIEEITTNATNPEIVKNLTPQDKKSKKHDPKADDYDEENTGDGSLDEEHAVYDVDEEDYEGENGADEEDEEDDDDYEGHEDEDDDEDDLDDLPEKFKQLKWEDDYVHKMATFVGEKGGKILQVGYGTGVASQTLEQCPGLTELYVIEPDEELFECLESWATEYPDVICIKGNWDQKVSEFGDEEFDGILFYSHPHGSEVQPVEGKGDEKITKCDSHFDFITRMGYSKLKKGGHLSYCNIRSWGDHLKDDKYQNDVMKMFQETQLEKLKKIGFTEDHIEIELEDVTIPEGISYYTHEQVTLVKLTK